MMQFVIHKFQRKQIEKNLKCTVTSSSSPVKNYTSDEILKITDHMRQWHEDSTKSSDVRYYKKISRSIHMIFNATWPPLSPHTTRSRWPQHKSHHIKMFSFHSLFFFHIILIFLVWLRWFSSVNSMRWPKYLFSVDSCGSGIATE
jgi:hypothetical protein